MTTRKFRAGARLNDPSPSGFARVDILCQEDLFPQEGCHFRNTRSKITNSYKVSEDSPFNNTVNHKIVDKSEEQSVEAQQLPNAIKTEIVCTRVASKAISANVNGELRPLMSKVAQQAIMKDRQEQQNIKEQIKLTKLREDAKWAEIEMKEAEATNKFLNKNDRSKKERQARLASVYQKEFTLHKKKVEDELEKERKEAERNMKIAAEEEAKEKEIAKKRKEAEKKRLQEFQNMNNSLLDKKRLRQQQELEIDKRVRKEHEEQEAKTLAREETLRKTREAKNMIRERIIELQTKQLSEKRKDFDATIENSASNLMEEERQMKAAEEEKRRRMREFRNKEWLESVKVRKAKEEDLRRIKRESFNEEKEVDDFRIAEEESRKKNVHSIMTVRMKQIEERKARERKEREEEIKNPPSTYFLKENDY